MPSHTSRTTPVLLLPLLVGPLAAQLRLVPAPERAEPAAVHLPTSYDEALAAAKQRDALMLLFFTATW